MSTRPSYSDDAVKHFGLVAWAENSKGTKYQRSSSGFDEDFDIVTTSFQVQNKTLSFRLGWRSSSNAPISAYCRVTISPSVDKDGKRIPGRQIHRLMNKKISATQTCYTTSNTDLFTRRYHPIFRPDPGDDDNVKLISACLEIRFLDPEITDDGLALFKVAVQAANDRGAVLDDKMINPHCESNSPEVTFRFDFFKCLAAAQCNSQPKTTDHSEPSGSNKRKRALESQPEEDDESTTIDKSNDYESIAGNQPAAQHERNNVESGFEFEDPLQTLQELTAEEKTLEEDLGRLIQAKRQRIEVMRKAINEFKKDVNSSTTS